MLGAMVLRSQELRGALGQGTERRLEARHWTGNVLCGDDPWLTWVYNSSEVMERKKKKHSFSELAYMDPVYLRVL